MTVLRFKVDKLIRDGLPAMMQAQGLTVFARRLDDAEFVERLKAKLVEEAVEGEAGSAGAAYYLARPGQYPQERP